MDMHTEYTLRLELQRTSDAPDAILNHKLVAYLDGKHVAGVVLSEEQAQQVYFQDAEDGAYKLLDAIYKAAEKRVQRDKRQKDAQAKGIFPV